MFCNYVITITASFTASILYLWMKIKEGAGVGKFCREDADGVHARRYPGKHVYSCEVYPL